MNPQVKNKIVGTLISFIGMGVFVVLFILGLIFFSYLLIIGAIVGLILFGIAYLRAKFFQQKVKKTEPSSTHKKVHHGRTIDHEKPSD